ncbi:cobyric acid synthase [Leptolyngbyaceae cyanobacterium CCMR0082]|uniref:Cobyric acid synthase n=1 Tax=Adonisia turfae CCMR0082 TaxID=2304604 RepID=A0A6M0S9L5_9CYAN|nr:cobyric acid synthase [Adonisia turfae]NEZ64763.1 cobyric acid synthase [Adonisia turfae CCMR0082]
MKALSVLGTSSNAGKSWIVTALGAWLRRQGVKVVPFKAQNMSNNSYVTLEGEEIGRAQAAQAAACGVRPVAEHNPVLLKPSGNGTSQLVLLGQPKQHIRAGDYYQHIEDIWQVVAQTLDSWRDRCDVLLLEGAGSPVELNLMHRDIVNLRPIQYLQGRWLLVGDIERGGIFSQIIGTHTLIPEPAKSLGLGFIVNKFRGDLSLFDTAGEHFAKHLPDFPYLGTLPYRGHLQPESEDSLCKEAEEFGSGAKFAWIRFPRVSNSQDSQPWQLDTGIRTCWVTTPEDLKDAQAIILPGSKNTLQDLEWLRKTGLAIAIQQAAQRGIPIVGICGGYQMLGQSLSDPHGYAGLAGEVPGLGLLPIATEFIAEKEVRQVSAISTHNNTTDTWQAYEIHMGQTQIMTSHIPASPLLKIEVQGTQRPEGNHCVHTWETTQSHVWGTYLHGLFESTSMRQALAQLAHVQDYRPGTISWQQQQFKLYDQMADTLEEYCDMALIRDWVDLV